MKGADEAAKGEMTQIRASTVQQKTQDVHMALQYAASFQCFVEEWQDCEELKPLPKDTWGFCGQKMTLRSIAWSGVRSRAKIVV